MVGAKRGHQRAERLSLSYMAFIMLYIHSRDFPGSSVGKESACNAGDPGSIPGP